jgi:hypothetical protein
MSHKIVELEKVKIWKWGSNRTHIKHRCFDCDEFIFTQPAHLKKHSGRCRLCCNKHNAKNLRKREYEALYNFFKRVNKEKGVSITYEDFLDFTKKSNCHYCKASIAWTKYAPKYDNRSLAYNLDRKIPNEPYSKQNCVVCCSTCNMTKTNRFTYEEFMKLSPILCEIQRNRVAITQKSDTIVEGQEEVQCKSGVCDI